MRRDDMTEAEVRAELHRQDRVVAVLRGALCAAGVPSGTVAQIIEHARRDG
jgi:hypothetical protein